MQTYTLFGCGGTGSNLVAQLCAYLESFHADKKEEWQLILIDGDDLEEKNLARQIFDKHQIGQNKAKALAEKFNNYPVTPIGRFVGSDDLKKLMQEGDIVFIGVDNYTLRALITARAYDMKDIVVINGGNELSDGSVQLWVREGGVNKTPSILYLHPEIKYIGKDDRSGMTCAQVAQLPGGEQMILANMAAAMYMLTALWNYHGGLKSDTWTEMNFDLAKHATNFMNNRKLRNWEKDLIPEGV